MDLNEARRLLDHAHALPDANDEKVELAERVVAIADAHNDVDLAFEARDLLVEAATFSGFPEKTLVAFTWLLAQCDADPDRFDDSDLLWKYKWVVGRLTDFPQISLARIDVAVEDMTARYKKHGCSMRPIHKLRRDIAQDMGDHQRARQWHELWATTAGDWMNDCAACEANALLEYYLYIGDDEAGLKQAQPILAGRLRCAEIPHHTHGNVLLPFWRRGDIAAVERSHREGVRLIGRRRSFVVTASKHVRWLVLSHNDEAALGLIGAYWPAAIASRDLNARFEFFVALRAYVRAAQQRHGVSLPLMPREARAAMRAQGFEEPYNLDALAAFLDCALDSIAGSFDTRNGTTWFRDCVVADRDLDALSRLHPLT